MVWRGGVTKKIFGRRGWLIFNRGVGNISEKREVSTGKAWRKNRRGGCDDPQRNFAFFIEHPRLLLLNFMENENVGDGRTCCQLFWFLIFLSNNIAKHVIMESL